MPENTVLLVGVLVGVVSPLVTALGLYLQYRREVKREQEERKKAVAEADKITADAEKTRAEAKAIDTKTDLDVLAFYINMVNTLRKEVDNLVQLGETNKREIEVLHRDKAKCLDDMEALKLEISEFKKKDGG